MNQSSTSELLPSSSNDVDVDLMSPLWKYITKKDETRDGGGNVNWKCNFYHLEKRTSYTRVRAHLLKISKLGIAACKKVKDHHIIEMKNLEEEVAKRAATNAFKLVPLSPFTGGVDGSGNTSKKRKEFGLIDKSFNVQARHELDVRVARFFYSSGIPFHTRRNPYFEDMISYAAVTDNLQGYKPPGYNLLRTTLLQHEKAHIERHLLLIKETWNEKGLSIVSNGWSDSQRRPLINFMAVGEKGPMFLKAVDCTGEIKDKNFIFNLMKEVVEQVGSENVVQIITDNAANCQAAGKLIESIYPNIFWTPCVVHTLNLALQNICAPKSTPNNHATYFNCSWIAQIVEDVTFIRNYINNHSMRLAMYHDFVPFKLLSIAPMRFASMVVMLKRFKLIKNALVGLVISERWSSYREEQSGNASSLGENKLVRRK